MPQKKSERIKSTFLLLKINQNKSLFMMTVLCVLIGVPCYKTPRGYPQLLFGNAYFGICAVFP